MTMSESSTSNKMKTYLVNGRYPRGVSSRGRRVRHRIARGRVFGIEDGLQLQAHGVGYTRRIYIRVSQDGYHG
jgi:hypothetical protein